MAGQLYTNNASTTLGYTCGDNDTSVATATGGGAKLASPTGGDWQMLTFVSPTDPTLFEIVKLTGRTDDSLTIERGQEGTGGVWPSLGLGWPAGTLIEARLTAGMLGRVSENTHPGVDGDKGLALATTQTTHGVRSVAIGPGALAAGSTSLAIHGWAFGQESIALGKAAAPRPNQFVMAAHSCIPRDDWWAGYGSAHNSFSDSGFASHFAELGQGRAWTSGLTVTDGEVIMPTVSNGFQYYIYAANYVQGEVNTRTEAAGSQPTWPTVIGDSWGTGSGGTQLEYVAANLTTGMDETIPAGMVFYPTEVGFICFTYSGVTAAPFISIGTAADPTLLVNNQQLTGITGASQRQAFSGLKDGITDLRIKLNTKATGAGSRFHGRFYAKGIFIQTQG